MTVIGHIRHGLLVLGFLNSIVRTFLRSLALISQPLLPEREQGSRIEVPLPSWERDLG